MLKNAPVHTGRGTSPAAPSGILAAAAVPHSPSPSRRAAPSAPFPAPQPQSPRGAGHCRLLSLRPSAPVRRRGRASAPARGRGIPGAARHLLQVLPRGSRCPRRQMMPTGRQEPTGGGSSAERRGAIPPADPPPRAVPLPLPLPSCPSRQQA